jgi:NADPH:quinone reductase-like Zn-dependent oxidoreductase
MQVVEISRHGGPDVFRLVDRPQQALTPGTVRIKVSAAGVNFADVMMRVGLYPEAPRVPFVPGYEVSGVVAETGPGVTGFRIGERVLAACRFGGYTDELVLPAAQVRPTPRRLTDVEAAAVPVAFMTAWIALVEMGRVRDDDTVLVPGAAGGVGSAIVQVAARAGARVTGVVGSASKKETVKSLGAEKVFTFDEFAGTPVEKEYTFILDARGGKPLKDSMRRLAPTGRVVSYGVSSLVTGPRRSLPRTVLGLLQTPFHTPIGLAMANAGIFGLNMLKLFDTPAGLALLARALEGVLEGFSEGKLKAVVGKVFPLAEAGRAHAYLQGRKSIGKVVLSCIKEIN